MPTKDFDPTQLQQWTVKIGSSETHDCISEPEYTYTYDHEWEPKWEPIKELTFRQKFALKRIIWKAWLKRVWGLDRD